MQGDGQLVCHHEQDRRSLTVQRHQAYQDAFQYHHRADKCAAVLPFFVEPGEPQHHKPRRHRQQHRNDQQQTFHPAILHVTLYTVALPSGYTRISDYSMFANSVKKCAKRHSVAINRRFIRWKAENSLCRSGLRKALFIYI
ncbi:hypothetical protein SDC9_187419 [bioreactor metagenome]|uniref:Uncharacterized protein n=1 Tax=bioreactor metagenome TaxID=1076179 RepID=A0A645HLG7_9ZZZZ